MPSAVGILGLQAGEDVNVEELMTKLREQGVDDVSKVASACMEADGEISVIKKGEETEKGRGKPKG